MKIRVFNISWDTKDSSGFSLAASPCLPSEMIVEVTAEQFNEEDFSLADVLSDEFGWCVNSLNYEIFA